MSLILDALRKLERERDANEPPGVLVVGSVPWGETSRARRVLLVAGAAASLALAVLAGWLLRPVPKAPAAAPTALTPEQPAAAAPTPPAATLPAAVAPVEPTAPPIRLSRPLPAPQPRVLAPSTAAPPTSATGSSGAPAEPAASEAPPPAPAAPNEQPAAATPADGLRLSAISQRDGKPVALINDHLVFEGDSFDGITVIRIGEAEVEVEVRGQRRILRF
jgi:hypothetical protein